MSIARLALFLCAAAGLCQAATPSAIASKVTSTLQGRSRVGIVCDYAKHQAQIREIAACLDPSIQVVVVDSRNPEDLQATCSILRRKEVDCVLMLSTDGLYTRKSPCGTQLQARMKKQGLPIVTTDQL